VPTHGQAEFSLIPPTQRTTMERRDEHLLRAGAQA
jgi:hypothetical protein